MICLHCGQDRPCRRRRLCNHCYRRKPGVRALYPPSGRCGRRGEPDLYCYRPAPTPTTATPGSLEKVLVIQRRVAGYQEVDHVADARDAHGEAEGQIRLLRALHLIPLCPQDRKAIAPARLAAAA